MTALIRTALTLAAHGWHIFPCRPGRKTPATEHGLLDATTNLGCHPDVVAQGAAI